MVAEFKYFTLAQAKQQTPSGHNVARFVLENIAIVTHPQQQRKSDEKINSFAAGMRSLLDTESIEWLTSYSQRRSRLDNYALPGYFIMTGRKGLQLITNDDGYFPVCQHPNLRERLLIFPPIGNISSVSDYLDQLEPWPENGVQLARIPVEEQASVIDKLRGKWEITPFQEDILDWGTYPIRVLPVKEMAMREGKHYKNHRRKYNYADKKVENLEVIEYWDHRKNEKVESFLHDWAQKKHLHDKSFSLDDYIAPYLNIISIHAHPGINSLCFLFEDSSDNIMGIVIVEILNGVAAAYMNIATDEIPYFPAYILMKTCDFLREHQLAEVLCLGGSERASLDKFKSDLQPCFARTDNRLSYHLSSLLIRPLSEPQLYL